jgi:hypothetical protein
MAVNEYRTSTRYYLTASDKNTDYQNDLRTLEQTEVEKKYPEMHRMHKRLEGLRNRMG